MAPQEKLLTTEYRVLPTRVREAMIASPDFQLLAIPDGEGFKLDAPHFPWERPPEALFPKLGIKSWRDSGRLRLCQVGQPIEPHLAAILAAPTEPQRITLRAWTDSGTPIFLYLFPFADFSEIAEARFLCTRGQVLLANACLRGASAQLFDARRPGMAALAGSLAAELGMDSVILDIGLRPGGELALVDVNPGLTAREVETLRPRRLS